MYRFCIAFFLLISFIPINNSAQQDYPTIDGVISLDEWIGDELIITMNNGREVEMVIIYSETDIYLSFKFEHITGSSELINRDPFSGRHDYFGIEFDTNNDGNIMGTLEYPDDIILFDYEEFGAVDMFSHSFRVFYDIDYDGTNDVEGASGQNGSYLIYEVRKPMQSNDQNGYDMGLSDGESIYMMIAIWKDKNTHSAAGSVNIEVNGSIFLEIPRDAMTTSEEKANAQESSLSSITNTNIKVNGFLIYMSVTSVCMILLMQRFFLKKLS